MVLRGAVVLLVGMSLGAGCGGAERHQECPPNAACAGKRCDPSLQGRRLEQLYREPQRALPPVVGYREVSWSCGRARSTMLVRQGIPASIAVFDGEQAFVSLDIPARSARNPLQPYYFPRASKVPRRGCKARVASGQIAYVDMSYGLVAFSPHERFSIALDPELRTPTVDGIPRLTPGQPVTVHALRCPGRKLLVAQSISG
jgi:hypothetical protein